MELLHSLNGKYHEWLIKNSPESMPCNYEETQMKRHYQDLMMQNFQVVMKIKPNMKLYREIMLYLHSAGELDRDAIFDPIQAYINYKLEKENWLYMYNTWMAND